VQKSNDRLKKPEYIGYSARILRLIEAADDLVSGVCWQFAAKNTILSAATILIALII
jgi:hypothetical protein